MSRDEQAEPRALSVGNPGVGDGATTKERPGIVEFPATALRHGWLLGLLLVAATLIAYHPAWRGGFIWDDETHIVHNRLLVEPDGLKRIWFSLEAPQYYPLVFTTFRLERALWGLNPTGYHFVNLWLHSVSALLLWRLLRQLGVRGAWLAAAVFALHPVNVESAAWITERKNTLSLFFFLLSLLLYLRFDQQSKQSKVPSLKSKVGSQNEASRITDYASSILHPPCSLCYGLSLLAFVLALFSKTAVAPLPVVLLLIAWWERGRVGGRDVWRSVPFFTAALVLIPLTVVVEHTAGSEIVRSDNCWSRLAGAGWGLWFYLYKAVLPVNLSFIYPRWRIDPAKMLSYVPGLLVVLGFAVCWRYRRGWGKPLLFGLGYFVVLLLPALGFVNIYFMRYSLVSDHWQYFAIIGPIALGAALVAEAAERLRSPRVLYGLGAVVLAVLGVLTWQQSKMYRDNETLWRTTLDRNPKAEMAYINLGEVLKDKGCMDEAIAQFEKVLRLQPDDADAYVDLGGALLQKRRADAAIACLQKALALQPGMAEAHNNLGNAFVQKGYLDQAITEYQNALRNDPSYAIARYNLGTALLEKGQAGAAILQFNRALEIQPGSAELHNRLGRALAEEGRIDQAMAHFQKALEMDPGFALARNNLGEALLQKGRAAEAAIHLRKAVELQPAFILAHYNLGNALVQLQSNAEAIANFQKAVELQPDFFLGHNNLGVVLLQTGQVEAAIVHFQKALALQPDSTEARRGLSAALSAQAQARDVASLQDALKSHPGDASAHVKLGRLLLQRGQASEAIAHFEQAIAIEPGRADVLNNLAWIRAANPQARLRNGAEAVRLAEQACQLTRRQNSAMLDTLAAAYAEAGRFADAVKTTEELHALALSAHDTNMVDAARQRLALYQAGQPYRDE